MADSAMHNGTAESADALACVRSRLERFRMGDSDAVLAAEALSEAAAAVAGTITPQVVSAVAWLYQYRALATGIFSGDDASMALTLFGKIDSVLPQEVPAHITEALTLSRLAPGDPLTALHARCVEAERLMETDDATAETLDRSTDLLVAALSGWPSFGLRRYQALGLLGRVLRRRSTYDAQGIVQLDQAISVLGEAMALVPPQELFGYVHAFNLSSAHLNRYDRTGDLRDLDSAAKAIRQALRMIAAGHAQRPRVQVQLAELLRTRWAAGSGPELLAEAIQLCKEAVQSVRASAPDRPYIFQAAATIGADWFDQTHEQADLDEAISHACVAVEGITDPADRGAVLATYGRLMSRQAQLTRRPSDHEAAEEALVEASRLAEGRPGEFAAYLGDLADSLRERYEADGDEAHLQAAEQHARRAVGVLGEGDTNGPVLMESLGHVLLIAYRATGDPGVLEEAVSRLRRAEELSPPGSRTRAVALLHLGIALIEQARLTLLPRLQTDLFDEAASVCRAAVNALPPGPDRLMAQNNAAALVRERSMDGDPPILYEAEQHYRNIIASAPESRVRRIASVNLALTLLDHHKSNTADGTRSVAAPEAVLDEAEKLLRSVRTGLPSHESESILVIEALARCVSARAALQGRMGPVPEAVALLRGVIGQDAQPLTDRASAAVRLGELFAQAGRWTDAEQTYAEAIELLAEAAGPQRTRAAQERNVGTFFGLASNAAASALQAGSAERAVCLLDRGRGLLLPSAWEPDPAACGATAGRTVVTLNVSRIRSDALITRDATTAVVPLTDLTPGAVNHQAATLLWAVQRLSDPDCPSDERRHLQDSDIPGVLLWLWRAAVRPVLEAMGITGPPGLGAPWPRIWWCPTGMLSFMPMHAAGTHGQAGGGPANENAMDRVVSSYTPSSRALRTAVRQGGNRCASPVAGSLLVVAPQTPGTPPLPQVEVELAALRRCRPDATFLIGPDATAEAILQAVPRYASLHFAGHGAQNVAVPGSAALLPYDHHPDGRRIGPADLERLRPDSARLAFLSACQTATGQLTLADEAVHLAGLLQAAGYPHVIGTQWTVQDAAAANVAAAFHQLLAAGVPEPAEALHAAMRGLRDKGAAPYAWAPFVHFGP